jgi:hypothetical protein
MTRFRYDADRRERDFRRRWKLLNRVDREDAERWVSLLRSDAPLPAIDRAEVASLLESLLLRGRQPGTKSSRYGDRMNRVARDVYERRETAKAATGQERMPRAALKALAKRAISDDYARHPLDQKEESELKVDDVVYRVLQGRL